MRSFALSAFTSLAFGIFCSAAPTPSSAPSLSLPPVPVAARDITVPGANPQTLQSVLIVATDAINPLVDEVATLHTAEGVEDLLRPILEKLVVVLETAVSGVEGLANIPVEESLVDLTTDVQLDLGGIVKLVAPLLELVLTLLKNVVDLVGGTVEPDLLSLMTKIATLLAQLLTSVIILVGTIVTGVAADVLKQLDALIPFILTLNVEELLRALGISWSQ
jgi:hypothetical protein